MLDDLGDPQTRSADNSGLLVEQNIKKFCPSDLGDFEQKIKDNGSKISQIRSNMILMRSRLKTK